MCRRSESPPHQWVERRGRTESRLWSSRLKLDGAHPIRTRKGYHLVSRLKLGPQLRLLCKFQNVEPTSVIPNDHCSRNTSRNRHHDPLNGG